MNARFMVIPSIQPKGTDNFQLYSCEITVIKMSLTKIEMYFRDDHRFKYEQISGMNRFLCRIE